MTSSFAPPAHEDQLYDVRVDGKTLRRHSWHLVALASARELESAYPDKVVAVRDLAAGEVVIV